MDAEVLSIHRRPHPRHRNLDRFITNRSAMDFDYARYMLTKSRKKKFVVDDEEDLSDYRKVIDRLFDINNPSRRILAFRDKTRTTGDRHPSPPPRDFLPSDTVPRFKPQKPSRVIPLFPGRTLDCPNLSGDATVNVLHWGSGNILCVALENTVHLWDESSGSASELVTFEDDIGPVTCVRWAPNGRHLVIGLNNSDVQLWDSISQSKVATFSHMKVPSGSMDWNNNHLLTTGGLDGKIFNIDVRMASPVVQKYRGHRGAVCGLEWSNSGKPLASGGSNNLLHVWDVRTRPWLYRLPEHRDAVRALAWSPFQADLLASGGGEGDQCIKFWNTHTGSSLNTVNTGSQVCALLWNKNERELLSSHGAPHNQLALWRYPLMKKEAELTAHTSPVLFMAESPDGCTVPSAAGDEALRFWHMFGFWKTVPKSTPEPFAHLLSRIR